MTHQSIPTLEEITEARELLNLAAGMTGCALADARLCGAFTALTWVIGNCECGCRREFEQMLIKLRAQKDQCEAAANEKGQQG